MIFFSATLLPVENSFAGLRLGALQVENSFVGFRLETLCRGKGAAGLSWEVVRRRWGADQNRVEGYESKKGCTG